jgi:hypothetical protein
MNTCVPVVVNHAVPVGACVRACVRAYVRTAGNGAVYSGFQCMLSADHSCCLWVPARPLVVGWLALRLSACEFGSAGAGLHFVMRSERMADAMREMGFEGELLVSTGFPPETHKHPGRWGVGGGQSAHKPVRRCDPTRAALRWARGGSAPPPPRASTPPARSTAPPAHTPNPRGARNESASVALP